MFFHFNLVEVFAWKMSEENPVQLKATRKKCKRKSLSTQEERACIIHLNNKTDAEVRPLTQHSFSKIKDVAELRKNCGNQNEHFDETITELPEHFDSSLHGSNRWCYKNFTNVSRLKRNISDTRVEDEAKSSKRRR